MVFLPVNRSIRDLAWKQVNFGLKISFKSTEPLTANGTSKSLPRSACEPVNFKIETVKHVLLPEKSAAEC